MSFEILALERELFEDYFLKSDQELEQIGARRVLADSDFGYPCRVSLVDANKGDELLLLNFEHLAANTPYRARHAIYVRKGVVSARLGRGVVPSALRARILSLRAFNVGHIMEEADVVEGEQLSEKLEAFFAMPNIDYVHIHFAKPGCYAARALRA